MNLPEPLRATWQERVAANPAWWTEHYMAALSRVEDNSGEIIMGDPNPHYYAPTEDASVCPGPTIIGLDGSEETPDEARARAFEVLVLADLAESAPLSLPGRAA